MPTEAAEPRPADSPPSGAEPAAARTAPAAPNRGWRQLFLLSGLLSTDNGEQSVAATLFPTMRTALGMPLSALGLLVGLSKLIGVVTGPLWVLAGHRWGRTRALVLCSGAWGVFTAAAGLAQNRWQLVLLFLVGAAGTSGGGPLVNGMVADLFDDRARGRAVGALYGLVALFVAALGPLMGQLSRVHDGWRYGFFAAGALQLVFGVLVARYFHDPGVGAAEAAPPTREATETAAPRAEAHAPSARPDAAEAAGARVTRARLAGLLRIRSFQIILGQRLFTGQLVLQSFGVVVLTDVYGFGNATASVITVPSALGYLTGSALGGVLADRVHARRPGTGRAWLLSWTTLLYGAAAFLATQVGWPSIGWFAVFFAVVGVLQGTNPGVNRPIVMSVTPPGLRGAAFAAMLAVEGLGWGLATLLVGFLGDAIGLKTAVLLVVVGSSLAGGLFLALLVRTVPRDMAAVTRPAPEPGR